ncbi:MAG: general secretion pathway protein GspB [Woeseiaceae bacterium]|nr:general secretion pathway protein GspB [Woeseiaceae bacterium]
MAPESAAPAAATPRPAARLQTIDELRLDGRLDLPELRVDLHVYSEQPGDRFVFINMNKYRENARLKEGPVVREIRPDGIALEHDGRDFLLPRE